MKTIAKLIVVVCAVSFVGWAVYDHYPEVAGTMTVVPHTNFQFTWMMGLCLGLGILGWKIVKAK